ncbi:MAG: helix-turn-helix domain-containing protein [Deltaproteobacteria bacterium]|nr:helix-turn-helix domain-containing protein [Deltaproteobacteria bacterium]
MDDAVMNKVYSVKEVAKMCHVSNETIRRWVRKRQLNAYNTTGGLAIKILGKDLAMFAQKLNVFVDWSGN